MADTAMPLESLIAAYGRGADDLARAIQGMTPEQLTDRPIAGKWSTLEVVCHLCDSEQVYADRIKRTIALDKPLVMGFDQSRYAAALAYHQRQASAELTLIAATRAQVAAILRMLPPEAWDRQAVHSEVGLRTLRQFVQTCVEHVAHHLRLIQDKRRALGP